MSVPAVIYLILTVIGLMVSANQHGKPKDGIHSIWGVIIGSGISISLLYWGGFFTVNP